MALPLSCHSRLNYLFSVPRKSHTVAFKSLSSNASASRRTISTLRKPQFTNKKHSDRSRGSIVRIHALSGGIHDYQPGELLGDRYQVENVIGRGGNGVTYRCTDNKTNTQVAVKALSLKSLRDWKQLELFEREAQILENLTHPAIPKYVDYFEVDSDGDKAFFLVQELADGLSLDAMIAKGWRPDETEITRIIKQLLSILQYLQSLRPPVVHRDIKPANIVLEGGKAGGKVFLVDFGGVQAAKSDSLGSTVVGTYGFMAPEQFRGAATVSSDAYSVGGTLLFLLSGKAPSAFPVDRLRVDISGVAMSARLRALCEGLLEPAVEDRLTVDQALSVLSGKRSSTGTSNRQGRGATIGGSAFRQRSSSQQQQQYPGMDPYMDSMAMIPQNQQQRGLRKIGKPVGTRVSVTKKGPTLIIDIPPARFDGNSAFTGAFAIAWNAFVGFWTVGALAGGGIFFALFSLPFWFAGANLLKRAFGPQFIRERLEINLKSWKLQKQLGLFKSGKMSFENGDDAQGVKKITGKSRDLAGADYQISGYINGEPQGNLVLRQGVESFVFGEGLDPLEQEWLTDVINKHIEENGDVMSEIAAFAGDDDDGFDDGAYNNMLEDGGVNSNSSKTGYDAFTQQEFDKFDRKLKQDIDADVKKVQNDAAKAAENARQQGRDAAQRVAQQQQQRERTAEERSLDPDSTIDVDDFEVRSVSED